MQRKKLELPERAVCNVVNVYRERGNYLQRLEQFEKAIEAYNEALRWNSGDVRSLLGRSVARSKATHYVGALEDAATAAKLEPQNVTALQIRAQTEYEKCAFERALVLAHHGRAGRRYPPDFAECARHAEETVKECSGEGACKVLLSAIPLLRRIELKRESMEPNTNVPVRKSRMQAKPTQQMEDMSRMEKQKHEHVSRLMASKYLERMAHDKYFLIALSKDERLASANKQGSQKLQELAEKALADLKKRQAVLRERRPLYAARASEEATRARLLHARKKQLTQTQRQYENDARRLVQTAATTYKERDTARCLELAEFAIEQISRKPTNLLPEKDKYLQELYDIVANTFLDQKRVRTTMSEMDREKRAFVLLGMQVSREPSRDSMLRVRPPVPPRDYKHRLRTLERALNLSTRPAERCYLLHELARLHADTKQANRARFLVIKCQSEARAAHLRVWLLNATFLLAKCNIQINNRPEGRATLLEGVALAKSFGFLDVAEFFETCADMSLEGEVETSELTLEKREKAMVDLMQDNDMRSAAELIFRRMSVLPASRRFSIMPGSRVEDSSPQPAANRRVSIMPRSQQPTRIAYKSQHPLGYQDFDT